MAQLVTSIQATQELSPLELLEILAARIRVFVVEQQCVYQEVDDADATAIHVSLRSGDQLVAYARIVPPDEAGNVSIGRVLTIPEQRHQQLARQLFQVALDEAGKRYPDRSIKIQAQSYLAEFYASFGFVPVSSPYFEDGIQHVDMMLDGTSVS